MLWCCCRTSTIDIVRLAGSPYGIGGRQGIIGRYLNPDSDAATPVMVIILGHIISDAGGWLH